MKTIVFPPSSPRGHYTTKAVVKQQLTSDDAFHIAADLIEQGLLVVPDVDEDGVLHLWPLEPVSTAGEVAILRAYNLETDCPIAWHGAVA